MSLLIDISNGESKTLEFKEKLPSNDIIAKTILAFSNTAGGKLIIGISDDRKIIGIDDSNIFEIKDKIANIIYDSCYPNILPEIYTMTIEDKLLLVVEVFRGNLIPYYLKKYGRDNGVFIRIGATNKKASIDNIMELERQRNNISYDEEINYNIDFDTLDLTPIYKQFEKQNKQIDINSQS
jgi:ATP-dependent DNA helicase RecG